MFYEKNRAYSPTGNILAYCVNNPGSYHDSKAFKESPMQKKVRVLGSKGFSLVCDSGFAKTDGLISTRKNCKESTSERNNRIELASARVAAEHGNASLKKKIRRLYCKLPANDEKRELILTTAIKYYNTITSLNPSNELSNRYGFSNNRDDQ